MLDELEGRFQICGRPFKLTERQVLIDRLIYDREVRLSTRPSHPLGCCAVGPQEVNE